MVMWAAAAWADSPLTSTNFSQAYDTHPMVEMAAGIEPGDFIPTTILNFLCDKDSPIDVRLAVINKLGWKFEGNNMAQQLGEYLMKKHKAKKLDKMYKKLDAAQCACMPTAKQCPTILTSMKPANWLTRP